MSEDTPKKTVKKKTVKAAPAAPAPPSKDTKTLDWLIDRLLERGGTYANLGIQASRMRA